MAPTEPGTRDRIAHDGRVDAAQPRGIGNPGRVVPQRHPRNRRLGLAHQRQCAPVETLDVHLVDLARGPDRGQDDIDEFLGCGRCFGLVGLDLGLDVVPHVGAVGVGQLENLGQHRDLVVAHHLSVGKTAEQLAAVQRTDLFEGEIVHEFPDVGIHRVTRERRRGVGALGLVDPRVVPHQRLAVLGEHDVELERADAEFEGLREGPQRLLGGLAAAAAVGLQVESGGCRGSGRHRLEGRSQREEQDDRSSQTHGEPRYPAGTGTVMTARADRPNRHRMFDRPKGSTP